MRAHRSIIGFRTSTPVPREQLRHWWESIRGLPPKTSSALGVASPALHGATGVLSPPAHPGCPPLDGVPGGLLYCYSDYKCVEPYVTVGSRGVASRRGDWNMPYRRFAARSANKPSTNLKTDGGDSHSALYRFNFRLVCANRSPISTGSAQAEPAEAKS